MLAAKGAPLYAETKSLVLAKCGDEPPTAANIEAELRAFRDAGPDDTMVLLLAGLSLSAHQRRRRDLGQKQRNQLGRRARAAASCS
jgi:hypothetical protein